MPNSDNYNTETLEVIQRYSSRLVDIRKIAQAKGVDAKSLPELKKAIQERNEALSRIENMRKGN